MISTLQKNSPLIVIAALIALVVSLLLYPEISGWIGIVMLVFSLGMTLFFAFQKYIGSYKRGEITRLKFTRNVLLDILGLLLTIAAASYVAGMAGIRLGASFGVWAGLIAGIAFAFVAAWLVRKLWGKISALLMV